MTRSFDERQSALYSYNSEVKITIKKCVTVNSSKVIIFSLWNDFNENLLQMKQVPQARLLHIKLKLQIVSQVLIQIDQTQIFKHTLWFVLILSQPVSLSAQPKDLGAGKWTVPTVRLL